MAKSQTVVFDGVGMTEKATNSTLQTKHSSEALCHAPITLFAIPKAFEGDADRIQRNAIQSWMQLNPAMDVLLFGDEPGIESFANEVGAFHESRLARNESGTPLVSSAFAAAHKLSDSPTLVYCNSDVILGPDFVRAIERLSSQTQLKQWLAIGQRTDVVIDREIEFESKTQVAWLEHRCKTEGEQSSRVCKEYFAFSRELFQNVPPFAVGRGNWDNWMVANAKANEIPIVDLTQQVTAIHQAHDYSHMNSSRMKCYVNGEEAIENQKLAGGRNLISGSTCTHRLGDNGIERIGIARAGFDFLQDIPRFAKLATQLLFGRS